VSELSYCNTSEAGMHTTPQTAFNCMNNDWKFFHCLSSFKIEAYIMLVGFVMINL
jgi:hypothetical protein